MSLLSNVNMLSAATNDTIIAQDWIAERTFDLKTLNYFCFRI